MGLTFDKLPVNTLVGADWQTFKALTDGQHIGDHYKGKFRLTKAVCRLLSPLVPIENRAYNKIAGQPLQEDPLFILGHWRSGTTFVHNVFACDKHFGYTTTYQTVFPHLVLWGQPFFKKNMAMLMPDKRPTDNMELRPDLASGRRVRIGKHDAIHLLQLLVFPRTMDGILRPLPDV